MKPERRRDPVAAEVGRWIGRTIAFGLLAAIVILVAYGLVSLAQAVAP